MYIYYYNKSKIQKYNSQSKMLMKMQALQKIPIILQKKELISQLRP